MYNFKIKKVFFLLILFLLVVNISNAWWNKSWDYRKKIEIDYSLIDSDLSNFPILVVLNSSNFNFSRAKTLGEDIRFVNSSDDFNLSYEFEEYNSTSEQAFIWIKIPIIKSASNSFFYLYYGNSEALNNQNTTEVWDDNFVAVWHLAEKGTGIRYDSTRNNNDGTPITPEGDEAMTGKIGGAYHFDGGDDYINVLDDSSLTFNDQFSIEFWYYKYAKERDWFLGKYATDDRSWAFGTSSTTADSYNYSFVELAFGDPVDGSFEGKQITSDEMLTYGVWNYLSTTFDSSSVNFYSNNNLPDSGTLLDGTIPSTIYDSLTNLTIGSDLGGDRFLWGNLDEIRISNISRSSAWIKATYYSTSNTLTTFNNEIQYIAYYSNFDSLETTNFSLVNDLSSVENLVLANSNVKIKWNNITNTLDQDFDSDLINGAGFVSVNSSSLDSSINSSSNITFFGVNCSIFDSVIYSNNLYDSAENILANGQICNETTSPSCNNIVCDSTNLTFTVEHFSSYTYNTSENKTSNLTIWDDSDSVDIYVNESITFYANYTMGNQSFLEGNCSIRFNTTGSWGSYENMSIVSNLYEYETNFSSNGTFYFQVNCTNSLGYPTLDTLDDFLILSSDNSWQIIVGNVSGKLTLEDNLGTKLIDWEVTDTNNSNIFVIDSDASVDFNSLFAITRNTSESYQSNDFSNIDEILSLENNSDNINNTFSSLGLPIATKNYNVYGYEINNVPIINSTNSNNFQTGILWDSSDDVSENGEFDISDNEDLVFISLVNENSLGVYGTYDFEIKFPADLKSQNGVNSTVALYVELK